MSKIEFDVESDTWTAPDNVGDCTPENQYMPDEVLGHVQAIAAPVASRTPPPPDFVPTDEWGMGRGEAVVPPPTLSDVDPEPPQTPPDDDSEQPAPTSTDETQESSTPELGGSDSQPPGVPPPPTGGEGAGDMADDDGDDGEEDGNEADTPSTPTPAPAEDVSQSPALSEVLRGRIVQIEDEKDELFSATFDNHPEALEAIAAAGAQLPLDCTEEERLAAHQAALHDRFAGNIPPEITQATERLRQLERESREVETQAYEAFVALREELVQEINWDKLLADALRRTENDLPDLGLWMMLGRGNEDDLGIASIGLLGIAEEWHRHVEERGYTLDRDAMPPLPHESEWLPNDEKDIAGMLGQWNELTVQAFSMESNARRQELEQRPDMQRLAIQIALAASIANHLGFSAEGSQAAPAEVGAALRRQTARLLQGLDIVDEYVMENLMEHGRPRVVGADIVHRYIDMPDPEAWVETKMHAFPDWFVSGIAEVGFVSVLPSASADVTSAGIYYNERRTMRLQAQPASLSKEEEEAFVRDLGPDDAKEVIKLAARYQIEEAWDHEAAHHAHGHNLSVVQLRDWAAVVKQEPLYITEYEEVAEQDPSKNRLAEAFCETVVMYKNNPFDLLLTGATERFRYMNDLLEMYDPDTVEDIIRQLETRTYASADDWQRAALQMRQRLNGDAPSYASAAGKEHDEIS